MHRPQHDKLARLSELYGERLESEELQPDKPDVSGGHAVTAGVAGARRSPDYYLGVITTATRMLDRAEGIAGELRGMIADAAAELHGVLGDERHWLAAPPESATVLPAPPVPGQRDATAADVDAHRRRGADEAAGPARGRRSG